MSQQAFSVLCSDGAAECIIAPEYPLAFPEGTAKGFSYIMPSIGPEHPWPASLVRMFKAFRTADVIYQRILYNMSPKLLATVLRIFRSIDNTFVSSYNGPTPHKAELRQQQSDKWQSSMRCGMNTVSVDKHGGVLACVDVNPFWTGELSYLAARRPGTRITLTSVCSVGASRSRRAAQGRVHQPCIQRRNGLPDFRTPSGSEADTDRCSRLQ